MDGQLETLGEAAMEHTMVKVVGAWETIHMFWLHESFSVVSDSLLEGSHFVVALLLPYQLIIDWMSRESRA